MMRKHKELPIKILSRDTVEIDYDITARSQIIKWANGIGNVTSSIFKLGAREVLRMMDSFEELSTDRPYSPDQPLFVRMRWLADNEVRSGIIEEAITKLEAARNLAEAQKLDHDRRCYPYKVAFDGCIDPVCRKAREFLEGLK